MCKLPECSRNHFNYLIPLDKQGGIWHNNQNALTKCGKTMAAKSTITEVARKAGVSISTVSHALSGKRPISCSVKERIFAAAASLDYRPAYAAQLMATRRTMQVGILVDEISNAQTGALISAIEQGLRDHGYKILLGIVSGNPDVARKYLRDFAGGVVDAALNMVGGIGVMEASALCPSVPVLTHLRPHQDSPAYVDFVAGALLAMEHLWGLGHRRIGLLAMNETNEETSLDQISLGYRQFFCRMGLDVDEGLMLCGNKEASGGVRLGALLFKRGATAVFSANDMMAVGILQWAVANGIKIPKELSVVSFDDSPLASVVAPPLTCVQLPVARMAELTVAAILRRIEGRPCLQQEILVPKLLIRNSTMPPPPRERRRT